MKFNLIIKLILLYLNLDNMTYIFNIILKLKNRKMIVNIIIKICL